MTLPLLLFATVPILQKEIFAQEIIGNEIIISNNNNETPNNVNEFLPKPQIHVSIEGTEKPDKFRGGDGNDVISGEDGDDTLQGNEGDDQIDGGDGSDVIDGGIGDDELKGGKGSDQFICDREYKIIDSIH
jgi:Ca2+-binding RTX toxin-like protein